MNWGPTENKGGKRHCRLIKLWCNVLQTNVAQYCVWPPHAEWPPYNAWECLGIQVCELPGQSIEPMPSSCMNCWHTTATLGLPLSAREGTQGTTVLSYGLTRVLRNSSWHLMTVWLTLASTWGAVQLSAEVPSHTITDPLLNQSWWRMLKAADGSPLCLQTLSYLSHVFSVNHLSSVKSRGGQSWCSLANAKSPAQFWAVITGPNCGRWALIPCWWRLFLAVWAGHGIESCRASLLVGNAPTLLETHVLKY